jgi:hypothetical protein
MLSPSMEINSGAVMRRIPGTWKKFEDAGGRSLYNIARGILSEANKLVPIKTGDLKRSGKIVPVMLSSGVKTYVIVYTMSYALKVHEDLDAFHPVGQAKYLEVPFRMASSTVRRTLAEDIRRDTR